MEVRTDPDVGRTILALESKSPCGAEDDHDDHQLDCAPPSTPSKDRADYDIHTIEFGNHLQNDHAFMLADWPMSDDRSTGASNVTRKLPCPISFDGHPFCTAQHLYTYLLLAEGYGCPALAKRIVTLPDLTLSELYALRSVETIAMHRVERKSKQRRREINTNLDTSGHATDDDELLSHERRRVHRKWGTVFPRLGEFMLRALRAKYFQHHSLAHALLATCPHPLREVLPVESKYQTYWTSPGGDMMGVLTVAIRSELRLAIDLPAEKRSQLWKAATSTAGSLLYHSIMLSPPLVHPPPPPPPPPPAAPAPTISSLHTPSTPHDNASPAPASSTASHRKCKRHRECIDMLPVKPTCQNPLQTPPPCESCGGFMAPFFSPFLLACDECGWQVIDWDEARYRHALTIAPRNVVVWPSGETTLQRPDLRSMQDFVFAKRRMEAKRRMLEVAPEAPFGHSFVRS